MANFQLEDFTRRSEKLLSDTRRVFSQYKDLKEDLNVDENSLPKTMQPDDGAIKLVFVGQYSAGKSSIIKMLTGIDVTIGAGIATQEAHGYKWGDLEIVDTPGIHTEIEGSDHDEKTYYQIDHAALLIFVVTAQGFDNRMGNHFRKLAFEQDRAKNMVLVVNKMDQTALGNVPEQQKIIAEDLKKVFVGTSYTPEQLYLSFTNTGYYFDWQTETDEEMKENLNKFVASRGVLSKIQSPLETLKSSITNVIGESKEHNIDKDVDKVQEILQRKKDTILDGKRRTKVEIQELANTCAQKIKAEGDKVAGAIMPGVSEEEINRKIEAAQSQAEIWVQNYEAQMVERLTSICEGVNEEIQLIDRSNVVANVRANIQNKSMNLTTIQNSNLPQNQDDEDPRKKFAKQMVTTESMMGLLQLGAKSAASITIPAFGNMQASSIVKGIGHFFNFKFKPWGAINVVKNVSNIIGAAGLLFSAYQAYKKFSGEEERKLNEAVRNAQSEVRRGFDEYADSVQKEFVTVATSKMEELTAPVLKSTQDNLEKFKTKKERFKTLGHSLQNILNDIKDLMDEVQKTVKA